jgi:hypothetical protein
LADACAAVPTDPRIYRWRATFAMERARAVDAGDSTRLRTDYHAVWAVLNQATLAGLDDNILVRLRAQAAGELWRLTGSAAALRHAEFAWREAVRRSPCNPRDYLQLALVQLDAGHDAAARVTFDQAVAVGRKLALDPSGPLTESEIQMFQDRWRARPPTSAPSRPQ